MNETDARLVLELFRNDWIQVLVAPYELCWELDLSVHVVLVLGRRAGAASRQTPAPTTARSTASSTTRCRCCCA